MKKSAATLRGVVRLYHTTDAPDQIMAEGFRDGEGQYLTTNVYRGVWLADVPLDSNEGAKGEHALVLEIPEPVVVPFEWVEERKTYREFLVPAETVNRYPVVERLSIYDERFWDLREG